MPYPDLTASTAVLDDRRLGKQRVETFQVLRALTWPAYGWKNHPAVRMWRGFTPALVCYGLATCDAWEARGFADATRGALLEFTGGRVPVWEDLLRGGQVPPWFGLDPVHLSHQSALLRKDPDYYRQFFGPDVPDDLPYFWPSAAFPRWPVRRGRADPLDLCHALSLLGLRELREPQRLALDAVRKGRDWTLELPPGGGATTTGLLAGLCAPGTTLWVTLAAPGERRARPVSGYPVPEPRPRAGGEGKPTGKLSASIAKVPTPVEHAAMADEAAAAPEFAFITAEQLEAEPPSAETTARLGLVVVDAGRLQDAGHAARERVEALRPAAAGLGRPVLVLLTAAPERPTVPPTGVSEERVGPEQQGAG